MKDVRPPKQLGPVVRRIVSYLCNSPDAKDTVEGIERWWLNEEYEKEEGSILVERQNIQKESKQQNLSLSKVINIIKEDDFSNWDIKEYKDMESAIKDIDGGHGIN